MNNSALQQLTPYLHSTYDQMQDLLQRRAVSDKLYGHWFAIWQWSVARHTFAHNQFYRKFGADRYWRRIYRISKIYDQLLNLKYRETV